MNKILWFNINPALKSGVNCTGSWVGALAHELVARKNIELVFCDYYDLIEERGAKHQRPSITTGKHWRDYPNENIVRRFKAVVRKYNPDLLHVWGTEWSGPYIAQKADLPFPILISLQGVASDIRRHAFGNLGIANTLLKLTIHDIIAKSGLFRYYLSLKRAAKMEAIVLRNGTHFECATKYMEAWVRYYNSTASVYQCPSMIRKDFYNYKWDIKASDKHSIFIADAVTTYKGFDIILRAVTLLVREYPTIRLRVAGPLKRDGILFQSGYEKYTNELIHKYNLGNNVCFLGSLTSAEMAKEMRKAHCAAIGSLIESQCLFLLEAMLVGVPIVVPFCGGMTDYYTNMESAIGYPTADFICLANGLRQIFQSEDLAIKLSNNAIRRTESEHLPDNIITCLCGIYENIIHNFKNRESYR